MLSSQGHTWLKDDEATHCKQCEKEFSISRRKVCVGLAPSWALLPLVLGRALGTSQVLWSRLVCWPVQGAPSLVWAAACSQNLKVLHFLRDRRECASIWQQMGWWCQCGRHSPFW